MAADRNAESDAPSLTIIVTWDDRKAAAVRDAQGRVRIYDEASGRYGWAKLGPTQYDGTS